MLILVVRNEIILIMKFVVLRKRQHTNSDISSGRYTQRSVQGLYKMLEWTALKFSPRRIVKGSKNINLTVIAFQIEVVMKLDTYRFHSAINQNIA